MADIKEKMEKVIDEKTFKGICDFLYKHPNIFCFFADPESDTIISAYKHKQIARRTTGQDFSEIKTALNLKTGDRARGQMAMKFSSMLFAFARDIVDEGMMKEMRKKGRKK